VSALASSGGRGTNGGSAIPAWVAPVAVLCLLLAIPSTVLALTRSNGSSPVNRQFVRFYTGPVRSFSPTRFDLPNMGLMSICAKGEISAKLSVSVSGAPSEFRVAVEINGRDHPLHPDWVEFRPGRSRLSSSYVFAGAVGTINGSDSHAVEVSLRSPTGKEATVWQATVTLQYQRGTPGTGGACF
jgi:hypothetical protein